MSKTPESTARRSQKRPHSPSDDGLPQSDQTLQESKPILGSEGKQEKLLRLLGGKKRKNEAAASKWLERVRTREDEIKLSTDLESQFNESLSNKISGSSYRRVGMGFQESSASNSDKKEAEETASSNIDELKKDSKNPNPVVDAGVPTGVSTPQNPNPIRPSESYPRYENQNYGYYPNYRPPNLHYRPTYSQPYPPPQSSYIQPPPYFRPPCRQNYEAPPRNYKPLPSPSSINKTEPNANQATNPPENKTSLLKSRKDFYAQFKKST